MTRTRDWMTQSDDLDPGEQRRLRFRGAPEGTQPFRWCADCQHRGYLAKSHAKRARRQHRGPRKGLGIWRCPQNDRIWHIGHRPQALSRGRINRQELAESMLAARARRTRRAMAAGKGRAA